MKTGFAYGLGVKNFCSLSVAMLLLFCAPQTQKKKSTVSTEPIVAEVKSDENGVLTAKISSGSKTSQLVSASENSGIKGSAVQFPPGALSIDTDISIEEGSSLATSSSTEELGIGDNALTPASSAVVLTSSTEADAVSPFALSIPMLDGMGLTIMSTDNLIVMYKIKKYKEGGKIVLGIMTKSQLTIAENKVTFSTQYFGSYQVVLTDTPITEAKQAESVKPIETKIEDKTPPTLRLTGAPSSSKTTDTLNIKVTGDDLFAYKYALFVGTSSDCSTATYSTEVAVGKVISDALASFSAGTLVLCAVGRDAAGNWISTSAATVATWTHGSGSTTTTTTTTSTTTTTTTTTPTLSIVSSNPAANASSISTSPSIAVTFSCEVNESTLAGRVGFKNLDNLHTRIAASYVKSNGQNYIFSPSNGNLLSKLPILSPQQNNYSLEFDTGILPVASAGCNNLVATSISFATVYQTWGTPSPWSYSSSFAYEHKLSINSLGSVFYSVYGFNGSYVLNTYIVRSGTFNQNTIILPAQLQTIPSPNNTFSFASVIDENDIAWVSYVDMNNNIHVEKSTDGGVNWTSDTNNYLGSTANINGLQMFLKTGVTPGIFYLVNTSGSNSLNVLKHDPSTTSGSTFIGNQLYSSGAQLKKLKLASPKGENLCLEFESDCLTSTCYYKVACDPANAGDFSIIQSLSPWASFTYHDHALILDELNQKAYSLNTSYVSGSSGNYELKIGTRDLTQTSGSFSVSTVAGIAGSTSTGNQYLKVKALQNYAAGFWAYPVSGTSYLIDGVYKNNSGWHVTNNNFSASDTPSTPFEMASNNKDEAVAAWMDQGSLKAWFFTGGAWAASPITIETSISNVYGLSIALDDFGTAFLAWIENSTRTANQNKLRRKVFSATHTTRTIEELHTFNSGNTPLPPLSGSSQKNLQNIWLQHTSGTAPTGVYRSILE